MAKTVKIIKKSLGTFFSCLQALTNCKVSEKNNEQFPRKSIANERTYVRMHVRTRLLRSQRPVGRDTKKDQGCHSGQVGARIFFNYHAPYGRQARIFGFVPKKYAPEALQARFFYAC